MLDTFKTLIKNQVEAAFCTLHTCIARCPEAVWNSRVRNYLACQVAFHTIFYADFHLGQNEESFRRQPFHRAHEHFFEDYEEFEDRAPASLYDKPSIKTYLEHFRNKASEVIAGETAETLRARAGFERHAFSPTRTACLQHPAHPAPSFAVEPAAQTRRQPGHSLDGIPVARGVTLLIPGRAL